jgi:protein involved in polysaccharide export with SLBB domain
MVQPRYMGRQHLLPWMVALWAALLLTPNCRSQDVTISGTPQQTNERIKELAGSFKSTTHDYLIGNGDLLSISVFDVPELNRDARVSQTGTVAIPLVPIRLELAGLTEAQAEQKIAEVLESNGLVTRPEVSVIVREHKSKPITIIGAVAHPLVYEADRSVTLLEAIAEAGGVTNDAGDTVIVSRSHAAATFVEISNPTTPSADQPPGSGAPPSDTSSLAAPALTASQDDHPAPSTSFPSAEDLAKNPAATPNSNPAPTSGQTLSSANTISINLDDLVEAGDMRNNIPLQAGDVVTIPHAGIVYVLGAVSRPGGFVIASDRTPLTAMKILALAGGLTRTAKSSHSYIIRLDAQGKQTHTEIDLKKILNRQAEDVPMRASDILYVPEDVVKSVALQAIALTVALGSSVAIYRLAYH